MKNHEARGTVQNKREPRGRVSRCASTRDQEGKARQKSSEEHVRKSLSHRCQRQHFTKYSSSKSQVLNSSKCMETENRIGNS